MMVDGLSMSAGCANGSGGAGGGNASAGLVDDVISGGGGDDVSGLSATASIVGATLGVAVVAVGTFGNVLVIMAVVLSRPLRKASNMFIVSLAVCDLFQTVLVRPLYVHAYTAGGWPFGGTVCRYALYASNLATLESILHVSTIALYRYVIIVHPAAARKFQSRRAVVALIGLVYLVPLSVVLLPAAARMRGGAPSAVAGRNVVFNAHIMFCVYVKLSGREDGFPGSLAGIVKKAAFLFTSAIFLFYCYIRIYHVVRASGRSINHQGAFSPTRLRREMTLLKTVIVVFVAFVVSYLPVTVLYAVDKSAALPDLLYVVAVLLLWCSSSVNWMIYGLMNRQFLQAYRAVLCGTPLAYNNHTTEPGSGQHASKLSALRELHEHRRMSRIRKESSPESACSVD